MATHTLAAGVIGAFEKTLVADTEDIVNFPVDLDQVRVMNIDGAESLYFTVTGVEPTVGGAHTYWLPAVAGATRTVDVPTAAATQVRLISAGTPTYSVEAP